MLMLAVQALNATEIIGIALGVLLSGGVVGSIVERRRNNRQNGPNCKPGLGQVCRDHGDGISANTAAIAGLGAHQEAIHKSQNETKEQLREMRKETHDGFKAVHKRLDVLVAKKE